MPALAPSSLTASSLVASERVNTPMRTQAVIHLGASSASLLVYQQDKEGEIEALEFLERPLPLASDIFRRGRFRNETLELAVSALRDFQQIMGEYQVPEREPERIVATNIIAEAANADVLLNRLSIGCGMDVEALDDGEMTRLIYLETQSLLRQYPQLSKGRSLVIHGGPGNTRLLLLKKGRIESYSNHRLGTHRLGQSEAADELLGQGLINFFAEGMRARIEAIEAEYGGQKIERVLAIGYEIQHLGEHIARDEDRVPLDSLEAEVEQMAKLMPEERLRAHRADFFSADALLPAAMLNARLGRHFGVDELLIPTREYERDLLSHLPYSATITESFADEVRQSARSLAKRYQVDETHALNVEAHCKRMFELLQPFHQLDARYLLLLRVAALTHEVGNFISAKAHHKHSLYIIANSELFGLSQADIELVATIARYHRHSPPKPSHELYAEMPRAQRLAVSKLAAILRLADALERAHSNRLQGVEMQLEKGAIRLISPDAIDLSIEQQALEEKGDFFRNVYGIKPILSARG